MSKLATEHTMKWFARLGYGARGLIYLVIGGLALISAIGVGGGTVDSRGAIQKVMQQPLGQTMLVVLVVGLLGYVSWRLIQAIKDTDQHGTSVKGLAVRGGLFVSAIAHALLAFYTITLLLATGSSGSSSGGDTALQKVLLPHRRARLCWHWWALRLLAPEHPISLRATKQAL